MNAQEKATIDALIAKRQSYKKEQVDLCFSLYRLLCNAGEYEEAKEYLRKIISLCVEDDFDLHRAEIALDLLRSFTE